MFYYLFSVRQIGKPNYIWAFIVGFIYYLYCLLDYNFGDSERMSYLFYVMNAFSPLVSLKFKIFDRYGFIFILHLFLYEYCSHGFLDFDYSGVFVVILCFTISVFSVFAYQFALKPLYFLCNIVSIRLAERMALFDLGNYKDNVGVITYLHCYNGDFVHSMCHFVFVNNLARKYRLKTLLRISEKYFIAARERGLNIGSEYFLSKYIENQIMDSSSAERFVNLFSKFDYSDILSIDVHDFPFDKELDEVILDNFYKAIIDVNLLRISN
jgi:hypothetical protein